MNEFRADLHCHTNCSDGIDDPIVLLHLAKQAGLKGLSITDHDTLGAYNPELFAEAEKLEIRLLSGIELSSEMEGNTVHILGYGFALDSFILRDFLVEIQKRRNERNRAILEKLTQKGMPISEAELIAFAGNRTIGRPHIAHLMIKKGYVQTPQDAFHLYLKDGGSCYSFGVKVPPQEAIDKIHQAKGKAILAHPHFLKGGSFLRKLLSLPFDGIECYYSQMPKELEHPWLQIAKEKNWIATGGSDYHGTMKPPLGASWVNKATFNALSTIA